jgi:integrase/recombinase XerD
MADSTPQIQVSPVSGIMTLKKTCMKSREKDNPKLRERTLRDGTKTLYLEYYLGRTSTPVTDVQGNPVYYTTGKMAGTLKYKVEHIRRKEELKLYLYAKPRNIEERTHNENTINKAREIRYKREQELLNSTMGYSVASRNGNLIANFENYIASYTKKDVRVMNLALNRFKEYLRQTYPLFTIKRTDAEIKAIEALWADSHRGSNGKHNLNPNEYYRFNLTQKQFNETMVRGFVDYLQANSKGSGAATLYKRFKKMVKSVVQEGLIKKNPCAEIVCKGNECAIKDVLSLEEIKALIHTHVNNENPDVRRAFLLTLFTGIRWCDVKELRYSNIDFQNKTLKFEQAKTKGHSAKSVVVMPLRDDLLDDVIGTPERQGKGRDDLIFSLPSYTMCLKALRHWTARAGIDKHITWHCGRHSFATNILESGANTKVVADLLGHSGLEYVERYVRAIDESKRRALNSLPKIEL